jgi:hypothetical protein
LINKNKTLLKVNESDDEDIECQKYLQIKKKFFLRKDKKLVLL